MPELLMFWKGICQNLAQPMDQINKFVNSEAFNTKLTGKQRDMVRRINSNLEKVKEDAKKLHEDINKKYGYKPAELEKQKQEAKKFLKDAYSAMNCKYELKPKKIIIRNVDYGVKKFEFLCTFWFNYFETKGLMEYYDKLYNEIGKKFPCVQLGACASTSAGPNEEEFYV